MKIKSFFLLSIFLISLVPSIRIEAAQEQSRSLSDALLLMYVSDALLLDEENLDLSISGTGLESPAQEDAFPTDDAALASMIHAAKQMRNDLDAKCQAAESTLRQSKMSCELEIVKSYCETQRNDINWAIGLLHKKRGDKRKRVTKIWHGIKRSGRNIWHWIGKPGRALFRQVGPEALKIVLSGGSLGGGVAKKLLKQAAKSMFKERISQAAFQRMERLLIGQIEILKAAGVDICDEEDQTQTEASEANTGEIQSSGLSSIPDGARWKCEDISGILTMLKSMEGPDMTIKKHELDFWLVYNKSGPTVHAYFSYQSVENWEDGVMTRTASAEDKSIPIDEYGVFRGRFEIDRITTSGNDVSKGHFAENFYGLISPQNYDTAYVCDVFDIDLPTGLHTLSPENFQQRCGWNHYYECSLTTQ